MKDKFYIFLDIDGVLWDWDFRKKEIDQGKIKKGGMIKDFNPESIKALNFLISEINKNFNCFLVISSTWRLDMKDTIEILNENGLDYHNEFLKTDFSLTPEKRGEREILPMTEDLNGNYCIIDDENFDYKQIFPQNKIIKTNIENSSLSLNQTKMWCEKNLISPELEMQ